MTNHDTIYNNLDDQNKSKTNYKKLLVVAKSCLTNTTASGISFAALRCLQKYYKPKNQSPSEVEDFSIGNPREFVGIKLVKNSWEFVAKESISGPAPKTSPALANIRIQNKQEYLEAVEGFIDHLVGAWDGPLKTPFENRSQQKNRKSIQAASRYKSLEEAFLDYQWENSDFIETTRKLLSFRRQIRSDDVINDKYKLYVTINLILRWGGVLKDHIAGKFLDMVLEDDLVEYIKWAKNSFSAKSNDWIEFPTPPAPNKLASDSGATKVYTMLCDGCVIYDDRVAASLCLLISDYVGEENELPSPLRLMSGKRGEQKNSRGGAQKTNRDPSTKRHRFIKKSTGIEHANSNLKANWIILTMAEKLMVQNNRFRHWVNQTCDDLYNEKADREERTWVAMRIIETSLFMAGHSVPRRLIK